MGEDGRVEQPKPSNLGSLSKSGNNEREQTASQSQRSWYVARRSYGGNTSPDTRLIALDLPLYHGTDGAETKT